MYVGNSLQKIKKSPMTMRRMTKEPSKKTINKRFQKSANKKSRV